MKVFKRVMSVLLVVILFIGSFVGSFALFNNGTFNFDTKYLAVFDEEENIYYLRRVPANIKFRVTTVNSVKSPEYSLADSEGNEVLSRCGRAAGNSFNIAPPAAGYIPGERYTLTLGADVYFADESLKDARGLVFCVEREAVEHYEFTDNVIEVPSAIKEVSDSVISLDGITTRPGEIIFGTNEDNEYVVYKIQELLDDGTASVTIPALDEIYAELEVYGEYEFDVDDIVTNPDLKAEIIRNVKNSDFYSSLLITAYAAERTKDAAIDVSFTPDTKANSVEIEIKLTLEPGENGLFGIGELKEHEVAITLKITLALNTHVNIQGLTDWDIAGSVTTGFTWKVELTRILKKGEVEQNLEDLFSNRTEFDNFDDYYIYKQYQNNIRKITDALNNIAADATGGELKLFDWNLPIPSIPGLYFGAEVKLFADFEMVASIVIGQETTTVYTVGICFTNNKFGIYSNTYRDEKDVTLSLRGKIEAKAGVKIEIKAAIISENVAGLTIDPQVGLYAEVYATIPIQGIEQATQNRLMYSYFEPGVYFSADFTAHLNLLVKQIDYNNTLVEQKFPIEAFVMGNKKIALGITTSATSARAVNNVVNLPDVLFEYYDVKAGINQTEVLDYSDLKLVSNEGEQLKVQSKKVTLPAATSSGSCYITATYLHSDGKTYSTTFRVLISGSILEGKVSAYTEDLSTGALEGALVQLYPATATTAIASQVTGEDGRFSFNVGEGSYRLVISADGYRTLTSNQTVQKDEIKYTEHILLMDNGQIGMGSAGGTVTNALTGRGVNDAQIRLREDWNNTSGPYVERVSIRTDSNGSYTLSDIPVGYYTVEASSDGYVTGYSNIIVLNQGARTDFDFTITPVLNPNEIRIVLTWGATPSDLDSHLIGRTPSDGTFNVFYNNKQYRYENVEMANLDVDDTTSYGPETVTILENIYGTYTYAVHDYTNRGSSSSTALSFSNAVVRVFVGSMQIAEYHVPTDQIGTYWTVFEISDAGQIMPVNVISNTKPTA